MKTNSKKNTIFIVLVIGMINLSNAQQRGGLRPTPPSFEKLLEKMDMQYSTMKMGILQNILVSMK